MIGGEVPELETTPCGGCAQPFGDGDDVVWDPWHAGDARVAAQPYHRGCADDVLPLAGEAALERVCGLCHPPLTDAEWARAVGELRARVEVAKVAPGTLPSVAWRLASRAPRRWVADHLSCLLERAGRGGAPAQPDAGALPGRVARPDE